MTARTVLADALRKDLPATYRVVDYPTNDPGTVSKPTVLAYQRTLTPRTADHRGLWDITLEVWVLAPDGNTSKGEDVLETSLSKVLGVLDSLAWLGIETCARADFVGKFPAYQITARAVAKNQE